MAAQYTPLQLVAPGRTNNWCTEGSQLSESPPGNPAVMPAEAIWLIGPTETAWPSPNIAFALIA